MNKKNLLYSFGGLAALTAPVAAVIACATPSVSQEKALIQKFYYDVTNVFNKINAQPEKTLDDIDSLEENTSIDSLEENKSIDSKFENIFGQKLPKLPQLNGTKFSLFLLEKTAAMAKFSTKLTWDLDKPTASSEQISRDFEIKLKEMDADQSISAAKRRIVPNYQTKNVNKKAAGFSLNDEISFVNLGIDEIKPLFGTEIVDVKVTKIGDSTEYDKVNNNLQKGSVEVTFNLKKGEKSQAQKIVVYGFKDSILHQNQEDVEAVKNAIKIDESKIEYPANYDEIESNHIIDLTKLGQGAITRHADEKNTKIDAKVKNVFIDHIAVEISISKGEGNEKIEAFIPFNIAKNQVKSLREFNQTVLDKFAEDNKTKLTDGTSFTSTKTWEEVDAAKAQLTNAENLAVAKLKPILGLEQDLPALPPTAKITKFVLGASEQEMSTMTLSLGEATKIIEIKIGWKTQSQ